jgi:hypothetical protein
MIPAPSPCPPGNPPAVNLTPHSSNEHRHHVRIDALNLARLQPTAIWRVRIAVRLGLVAGAGRAQTVSDVFARA